MKLRILYEAIDIQDDKEYLAGLLHKAGISGPTVDKILAFDDHHGQPGGAGREIEQLDHGQRLVAWLDNPAPGYEWTMRNDNNGGYITTPENVDVAILLRDTRIFSIAHDILNGLAFGYGYEGVRDYVNSALPLKLLKNTLRSIAPRIKSSVVASFHDNEIQINHANPSQLVDELRAGGIDAKQTGQYTVGIYGLEIPKLVTKSDLISRR